jgi:hypothetical protein
MKSRRWREIERLFFAAASHPASDRDRFLDEACGADEELRREVESLLDHDATAGSILARPLLENVPDSERQRPDGAAGSMPLWARGVVIAASLLSAVALALYLSQWSEPAAGTVPPWLLALLTTIFAVFGLALTFGHKHDARAAWLGGFFATVGTQLAMPLLRTGAGASFLGLEYLRVDAFAAAFLWYFLCYFPATMEKRRRALTTRVADAAAIVAFICVVANLASLLAPERVPGWADLFLITTTQPGRTYWLVIYGMSLPATVLLLYRAVTAAGPERHRAATFVIGLLAGSVPFVIEVVAEELVPAYKQWAHGPGVEPVIAVLIFGALAFVPFVTAYSVLFDRVVEVRVALRTAAQYVLARYTVGILAVVPIAALVLYLFAHREERIASLATGGRPMLLGAFAAAGLVTFRLRTRWLHALDKRYFRESYDARDIVTRLAGEWQPASLEYLATELAAEIEQAIHATATFFAVDATGSVLRAVDGRAADLPVSSTIARLTFGDARPMDVDPRVADSALSRVPPDERQWLTSGNFRLLLGLKRMSGAPLGLIGFSAKRSELPYTTHDRRFLMAIASTAAAAMTRIQMGQAGEPSSNPRAVECLACGLIEDAAAARCRCGGEFVPAAIPLTLRGVFTFRQRIGAGGMGVVYKAWDQTLERDVAVKALPRVTPEMQSRLRHEARAMAAVTHANLATVYGIETWQSTPLIVQEFLSGGTLSQRLSDQRLGVSEILDLGVTLADVLDYLHRHGVIHCDIKPSNIGFTHDGVVKVLDFGLARVMHEARAATTGRLDRSIRDRSAAAWELSGGWFGTPHFMSPEAALGRPPAPSFDLWALGVVLYEAIAGHRPFEGESAFQILARIVNGPTPDIRTLSADTPASIADFLARVLSHDAARRPATGALFANELRGLRAAI